MSGKIAVAPYISNESITYGSPEEAVKQFHLVLYNAIDAASDHLRVFSSKMDWLADDLLDSAKDHWSVLHDWGLVQFGDKKK